MQIKFHNIINLKSQILISKQFSIQISTLNFQCNFQEEIEQIAYQDNKEEIVNNPKLFTKEKVRSRMNSLIIKEYSNFKAMTKTL